MAEQQHADGTCHQPEAFSHHGMIGDMRQRSNRRGTLLASPSDEVTPSNARGQEMKVCAAAFVTCVAMNVSPVMGQNLTAAIVATQGSTMTGSIAGCIVDTMQQPLPGATVVATGNGIQRSTVTNGAGCYELKDLPLALYRVTARLTGYDNVTHDRLIVAPAQATRLDLTTRLSPICECVRVAGGLTEHWNHAAAVLHLRLADSEPGSSTPQGYYRHLATVIRILKRPAGLRSDAMFVLQNQRSGTSGPYDVGQELVAFLESSETNAYQITNDEPGLAAGGGDAAAIAFLVQDGRIQQAPPGFSQYLGMSIDSFLEELRTLSRRQ